MKFGGKTGIKVILKPEFQKREEEEKRRRRMGNHVQCFIYWRGESYSQTILGMGLERHEILTHFVHWI